MECKGSRADGRLDVDAPRTVDSAPEVTAGATGRERRMGTVNEWNEVAAQLGVDSIRSSTAAGSGHPTSSLSAAHLLAVLWSDHLRYDVADPKSLANDRFVLSKGHASPLMFS